MVFPLEQEVGCVHPSHFFFSPDMNLSSAITSSFLCTRRGSGGHVKTRGEINHSIKPETEKKRNNDSVIAPSIIS
jgi:hypothetical protein